MRDNTDSLMRRFLEQLAGHFGNDAQLVPKHRLCAIVAGRLVPVCVDTYAEPSKTAPDRPLVLRVTIGKYSLPSAKQLKRLGERIARTSPFKPWLELSLLPDELLPTVGWVCEWIKRQATGTPIPPPTPPFKLVDGVYEVFHHPDRDWRSCTYLWSANAQRIYRNWSDDAAGRRADELQFADSIFREKYPKIDLPKGGVVYEKPAWPSDWSKDGDVRGVRLFRPGVREGHYLVGSRVDTEVKSTCERGYIFIPANCRSSEFWWAWISTWFEYCNMPGHRRPYIRVIVGRKHPSFARKILLEWDWITLDPTGDPSEDLERDPRCQRWDDPEFQQSWDEVKERLNQFYQAMPRDEYKRLFGELDHHMANGKVGHVVVREDDDEPMRWVMSWLAEQYAAL